MKKIIKETNNSAVVGIVTAMLLIGLIVTVISIIQLVYVPIIMEQREAEHMDRVAEQFGFITSVIDNQAADERNNIPIASFLTLGSKELPFLVSSKAYGTLEVLENSCTINIQNDSINNIYPIGTIKYSSSNAYYLDQSYTYEAGAMIVSQFSGNKTLVPPNFIVDYNKISNTINISFDVVNISSVGKKTIASGSGICGIQTEFHNISTNITFTDVDNMTITTSLSNAWFVFINQSLMRAGLDLTQFNLNKIGQDVMLDFEDPLKLNINFKIIKIQAQIGPGWIE